MAVNHQIACPSCNKMVWITTADDLDIKSVSNTKGWTVDYDEKINCAHCGNVIWVWFKKHRS